MKPCIYCGHLLGDLDNWCHGCRNFQGSFISSPEHAAEVRRGDAEFPVERVVGGERQRATTPHERLEGNSQLGVTPHRRTESHHGNDGSMVVTPNIAVSGGGGADVH